MIKRVSWILALGLLAACSSGGSAVAEVSQPAPDFTEPSVDGGQVSLGDYDGQTVLLYFSMADG
jgi:hypothetical protein